MINKVIVLVLSFFVAGALFSANPAQTLAQEINQDGDVIYLGTTATPNPSPTPTTITTIGTNAEPTVYRFGNSYLTIPAGFFPDFKTLMSWILQIVLIISVLLVLFQLVFSGVNWITSGGDKSKTDSARSRIVAAVIGLIIVVASWAIFLFILQLIGIDPGAVLPLFS